MVKKLPAIHPNLSGQQVYRDELVYHLRFGLGLVDVTPPSSTKQGRRAASC